eukprot:643608-Prymnesium_polylepis.2
MNSGLACHSGGLASYTRDTRCSVRAASVWSASHAPVSLSPRSRSDRLRFLQRKWRPMGRRGRSPEQLAARA